MSIFSSPDTDVAGYDGPSIWDKLTPDGLSSHRELLEKSDRELIEEHDDLSGDPDPGDLEKLKLIREELRRRNVKRRQENQILLTVVLLIASLFQFFVVLISHF